MVHTDKTSGQIRLKEVVFDAKEDLGIDDRWYKNLLRWAIRSYSDLSIHTLNFYEEAKLTPNDLNIITVPDDFINLVAMGFAYYGRFWRLGNDNNFITTTTTNGVDEELDSDEGEGVAIGDKAYWHYGETGGKNQYSIAWINSTQFMVNGTPSTQFVLRYVSSGISQTGNTYVSALCREYIIADIKEMYLIRIKASDVEIKRAGERKYEEYSKLEFANFASVQDITDAIYESWSQTIKR